ncbi:alpha/beta hydrolase [Cereibacter sphaeroides]|uniref:alpha/beta fold hydrolase n=1 Tax=Cereibacter sphaeroides TaxID=1063 RepID=UPI001F430193|nr:alpha/beta hydrolase [Cereibacter sphaeroides]MCE6958371.1 alpha/beta hydrolase [Cereibacter sphaeroides]MCE6972238.1 alpha/beta hydrolase [Cereibacter sphaeroides]
MIIGKLALGLLASVIGNAAAAEQDLMLEYPRSGPLLAVSGGRVHANVEGEGPDLVLIHGASGNLRDFTFDLVKRLKAEFRVIALDRPGHGWSELDAPGGNDVETAAAMLREAAAALGVSRPIVLGHSYGGAVALAWGLQDPIGTHGLVILAGASMPFGATGRPVTLSEERFAPPPALPRMVVATLVDQTLARIFAPQIPPPGYADNIGAPLALRPGTFRLNAWQLATLSSDLEPMVRRYTDLPLPVEIVHGADDRTVSVRSHAASLARLLPNATLTILEGVGHMPHHAEPEAVVAAIRRVAAQKRSDAG